MDPPSPPHPAALDADVLASQCRVERVRGSGPGGQHRNKVETGIRLTHTPTGITAQATERRSQAENHHVAMRRLRIRLALAVRSAWAAPAPSTLWRSRTRGGRLAVNPAHADFPALLAEALDAMAAHEDDPAAAAGWAGVSSSQLVRFLKAEPAALEQVNAARRARELRPLR